VDISGHDPACPPDDYECIDYYVRTGKEELGITLNGFTVDESYTIINAAYDLADAMGGASNLRENLGGVSIVKKDLPVLGYGKAHSVELDPDLFNGYNPDSGNPQWTIVHELAHAWDANTWWKLSRKLEKETGGHTSERGGLMKKYRGFCTDKSLPGCNNAGYFYGDIPVKGSNANFNRVEDFAESVTAYVYPDMANTMKHKKHKPFHPLYYDDYRNTKRWQIINELMQ